MAEETKRCPFCGEEILAAAIKCKHCQSMLNGGGPTIPAPSGGQSPQPIPAAPNVTAIDYFKTVAGTLLAVTAIFFLGRVYIWSCSIPFINWLMPLFYGGIAAFLIFPVIWTFRSDHLALFIIFGVVAALVAYYANWVWFVYDFYDDFIMAPGELCDRIQRIHAVRRLDVYGLINFKNLRFTAEGPLLTCFWLAEPAMIVGGVASGIVAAHGRSFFCTACRRWSYEEILIYDLASEKDEYELTSLDAIMQMTAPEEDGDHYTVKVFECPRCKNGAFSLAKKKVVLKNGRCKTESKTLLRRIFCPAGKLKALKEFVTVTGRKGKE